MAVIWAVRPCYIVMSPSPLAARGADCSAVLLSRVLRGSCIILHHLLLCQRRGYRYTVACTEILQLPPTIKRGMPYAFWLSLGKTSGETSAVCLVSLSNCLSKVCCYYFALESPPASSVPLSIVSFCSVFVLFLFCFVLPLLFVLPAQPQLLPPPWQNEQQSCRREMGKTERGESDLFLKNSSLISPLVPQWWMFYGQC